MDKISGSVIPWVLVPIVNFRDVNDRNITHYRWVRVAILSRENG